MTAERPCTCWRSKIGRARQWPRWCLQLGQWPAGGWTGRGPGRPEYADASYHASILFLAHCATQELYLHAAHGTRGSAPVMGCLGSPLLAQGHHAALTCQRRSLIEGYVKKSLEIDEHHRLRHQLIQPVFTEGAPAPLPAAAAWQACFTSFGSVRNLFWGIGCSHRCFVCILIDSPAYQKATRQLCSSWPARPLRSLRLLYIAGGQIVDEESVAAGDWRISLTRRQACFTGAPCAIAASSTRQVSRC